MNKKIELLDCTLRDGAYIVNAEFGKTAMNGIIKKMQDANIDIIECGWLKDSPHKVGTSFYHIPKDIEQYLTHKSSRSIYVVMIDWDRYDVSTLPVCDGKSADAIRVVFPYGKHKEGIAVGAEIKKKGYGVFFQAANTLAYSETDLIELANEVNKCKPIALSVVDTFGAMYHEDVERIVKILDKYLDKDIKLGFHSHNNQQLSFALTMHFCEILNRSERQVIVDSSLCGMGRGAGNATTELMANYLDLKHHGNYDMNIIMDAIDTYMCQFLENYSWGYSTPYFIAGMYCCHVNNIAYLQKNHRTNAKDMKNIIESLSAEERKKYDYDKLEQRYIDNQNRHVDDEEVLADLHNKLSGRKILLIAPGNTVVTEKDKIDAYIKKEAPIVIGVNAVNEAYNYDYLFFINTIRYDYAKDSYSEQFSSCPKILLSSIKTKGDEDEYIINFTRVMKRGWEHFDNAVIDCLRLLDRLMVGEVAIAGFDSFLNKYNESYADKSLPTLNPNNQWEELNSEITDMYRDFKHSTRENMKIEFLTESIFNK